MASKHDETRLYAWVRVFGAVLLFISAVIAGLAFVFLPIIVPHYTVSEGTVVVILGSFLTSASALVGIKVVLRRNGE